MPLVTVLNTSLKRIVCQFGTDCAKRLEPFESPQEYLKKKGGGV